MTVNDGAVIGTTQIYGSAPQNRAFNLVILAEGFKADEQDDFNVAADAVVAELVKTAPFDDFTPLINAFRINVSSTDSGADDPHRRAGRAPSSTRTSTRPSAVTGSSSAR